MESYNEVRKGVEAIGLDWLGRGRRGRCGRGGRMPAGLVPSAQPFPHSSPHLFPSQSPSSPLSTSI